MDDRRSNIVRLTHTVAQGDPAAAAELIPLVYEELRAIAGGMLKDQRPGHTLQPTALVNEAYLKIAGAGHESWSGRQHFLAVASVAMRQILVNHARDRRAQKRGGDAWQRVSLSDTPAPGADTADVDLLALDEALAKLDQLDPTQARIVELRYFGGLAAADIASLLNISERTVGREWRMARAHLASFLRAEKDAP